MIHTPHVGADLIHGVCPSPLSSVGGPTLLSHYIKGNEILACDSCLSVQTAACTTSRDVMQWKQTVYMIIRTHTCSETSYRISDVECIACAKTLQLNLTGNSE